VEEECHNRIYFLDISIERFAEGRFEYQWYTKPTASGRLLSFYSYHPFRQKLNVMTNLISRALRLSNGKHWDNIKTKLFGLFLDNGYPKNLINRQWHSQCAVIANSRRYKSLHGINILTKENTNVKKTKDGKNIVYTSVTYIKGLSESIQHIYNDNGINKIKFGYKGINKIGNMYPPVKEILPCHQKTNVVYKIKCKECEKVYIGQTKHLGNRIKQHQDDIKYKSGKTALCNHACNESHVIEFDKAQILDKEPNYKKREHLEALYIIKHNELAMNAKTDVGMKGLLYSNIVMPNR